MKHHFEIMEEDGVDTDTTSDLAQSWILICRIVVESWKLVDRFSNYIEE